MPATVIERCGERNAHRLWDDLFLYARIERTVTDRFNTNLDGVLAQLAGALPGIQFTRLDVYGKLNNVVAQPQMFGLRNVTTACITPNVAPFACKPADVFSSGTAFIPPGRGTASSREPPFLSLKAGLCATAR